MKLIDADELKKRFMMIALLVEISISSVHGHMREMIKEGILETDG